jgi:hypothetical protein
MMRRSQWRTGVVAVVVSAGFVVAGCGGEVAQEAAERSPDPVIAAAGAAADEETAQLSMTVAFSGVSDTLEMRGPVDLIDGDEAQLTMEVSGEGQSEQLELRVVGGESFVSNPAPAAGQPGWFRVPAGQQPFEGSAGSVTDPFQALTMLDSIVDTQEAGTVDLDGEEMTVQRGTLDLTEAADDAAQENQLAALGLTEVPVEVAIDSEGRLRRLTITADLSELAQQAGGQNPGTMTITIELDEFGTAVEVRPPPSDQTGDLPVPSPEQQAPSA